MNISEQYMSQFTITITHTYVKMYMLNLVGN